MAATPSLTDFAQRLPALRKQKALTQQQLTARIETHVQQLKRYEASLGVAPVEDEEITQEMAPSLDCAKASLAAGESIAHDDMLREFRPEF